MKLLLQEFLFLDVFSSFEKKKKFDKWQKKIAI